MVEEEKVLVLDLDGTICKKKKQGESYKDVGPNKAIIEKIKEYKRKGFSIIIYSSRNMRTFRGNMGKINAITLKIVLEWLDAHQVPYDEIHVGRPWCGFEGFYVDDKTIRPDEFLSMSTKEIKELLSYRKTRKENE